MRAAVRLMVVGEEKCMGPGVRMLLERIAEHASLRAAARDMEMSYTKALRLLRTLERELGFPVVLSEKGGAQRGGTRLTERGALVLRRFQEMERAVQDYAQALVDEHFVF